MPKVSRQYERAQRQRIVGGATRAFARDGYAATTIDQIGRELGLSKGSIYTYFGSKEDLFVASLQSIYDSRFEALATACAADDAIEEKFSKILEKLADIVSPRDDVFARLSLAGFLESSRIPRLLEIKTASHQRFGGLVQRLLREGQQAGKVRADLNIPSVTVVLLAVSDGLMVHSLVPGRGIKPKQVQRVLRETFLPMLGAAPAAPSETA
jgi:AcrR family transcriptional regulator